MPKQPWEKPLAELYPENKYGRVPTPPEVYQPGSVEKPKRWNHKITQAEAWESRQRLHDDFINGRPAKEIVVEDEKAKRKRREKCKRCGNPILTNSQYLEFCRGSCYAAYRRG